MAAPQPEPEPKRQPASDLVRMEVLLPLSWRNELVRAAREQGLSTGALTRLILRGFLRGRLTDRERALLERGS